MIKRMLYENVMLETIHRGASVIPGDIDAAFRGAIERETSSAARDGLQKTYDSLLVSARDGSPACPDTGWPVFYFKVGNECVIEGGFMALEDATRCAVERATHAGYIRATMKHPLTGYDTGNNLGSNIPSFTYQFVPGDFLEVTYVAKGGGSECFGGTRHRVVAFADEVKGIERFVVDAFVDATRSGGICPPNIIGVGIGGTANVAANLAKEAACLRTVGSQHPEERIHRIEENLHTALNRLGVGIMGIGGKTSVFAVNVEYAYTHIAGICVAISSNCMVARRSTSHLASDGSVTLMSSADWFNGR